MARQQGTFDFSANFEVKIQGMIDARQLVDDFADLLNFTLNDNYIPNGFFVAVAGVTDPAERGIYQCIDRDNLSLAASWEKISITETELNQYLAQIEIALEEDVATNITVGASEAYTIIPSGTTFTEYVKLVHQTTFEPTFVNPTFNLSRGATSLYKIDDTASFNLTFTFNRGQIRGDLVGNIWDPNAVQDFRAGAAIEYTIDGVTQPGNVLGRNEIVVQGINSYDGTVTYDVGTQPLDSNGDNFGSPFPAGTSPIQTASYEGVHPIYATTSDITVDTEQQLYSMINANNIELVLVPEINGNKQFFDIPQLWLNDRPLTKIEFFNTVSNQFDNTDQLATFSTATLQKNVTNGGTNVDYVRYTNNTPDRGELRIKLIF